MSGHPLQLHAAASHLLQMENASTTFFGPRGVSPRRAVALMLTSIPPEPTPTFVCHADAELERLEMLTAYVLGAPRPSQPSKALQIGTPPHSSSLRKPSSSLESSTEWSHVWRVVFGWDLPMNHFTVSHLPIGTGVLRSTARLETRRARRSRVDEGRGAHFFGW